MIEHMYDHGMLEQLEQAIEEAPLAADGASLVAAYRLLDRLSARVRAAAGTFDRAQLWELDGATSMTAWLKGRAGRSGPEAAAIVKRARVAGLLPETQGASERGEITEAQVATIASYVGRHVDSFAEQEAELVPLLAECDLAGTDAAMRRWRAAADDASPVEPLEPSQALHVSRVGGRGAVNGDLALDTLAVFEEALDRADARDLSKPLSQRRAEGLDTICRHFLAHSDDDVVPKRRPRAMLVVTPEEYASGDYGLDLCDAEIHRLVVEGRSTIIDLGRSTRTVSPRQRELLAVRDQHCRFPGCERPASWCDAHHVQPWEHGGATDLDNLVMLCRRHHRLLHKRRRGFRAKLLPDATFEVTWPDGHTETTYVQLRQREFGSCVWPSASCG